MPTLPINDIDIYYEDLGQGEPLVMIPGLGGTVELFAPQIAYFRQFYRVIVLDNRGAGRSSTPPGPYSMDQLAADLAGLLDALKITQPVRLLGASMGGVIAQCFIHNYPERVKQLVLVCTGVSGGDPHITLPPMSVLQKLSAPGNTPRERLASLFSIFYPPAFLEANPDLIDKALAFAAVVAPQPSHARTAQLQAVQDVRPYYKWLAEITVPTLIMHGEEDLVWPLKNARTLQEGTQGRAELALFPGAGHVLFQEQPAAFNARLEAFLKRDGA
ncbi:MAG: alpha/beta hydrolase [Proteobacteria bacterium]|nr:alpha/beta hydrolase [Pseudomonadota bacterium]